MTEKHTPGPWIATQDHSLRDPSAWVVKHKTKVATSHIAQLHPVSLAPEAGGDVEANARLIAATPRILEALEECLALLDSCLDGRPRTLAIADRARAAIAKATTE